MCEGKSRVNVGARAGNVWRARAGHVWDKGRVRVGQGQVTYGKGQGTCRGQGQVTYGSKAGLV